MRLRKLNIKDAPFMLQWMHDESVVKDLKTDFFSKTIRDCENFIADSNRSEDTNIHWAIVDEEDNYMGTVSLKNIDNSKAEFGITVSKKAMGKGYSIFAMNQMIEYGFRELKLKTIFWCVSEKNTRAVRFYDKNEFKRVEMTGKTVRGYTREQVDEYIWYAVERD